ncbi:hypothetical protein FQR65_LT16341 [Abscondita terminalis]|nr:hypothetical protein FQR65_LT16341 [Abscondita terminalis]
MKTTIKTHRVTGDLVIYGGIEVDIRNLTEVSGSIDVSENATLTVPALTKSGSILRERERNPHSSGTDEIRFIYVSENATLTAPALTEVSGSIYVSENATLTAPALTKSCYIYVSENATLTAPALTKSGSIYVSENATLTAPALTKSGSIYLEEEKVRKMTVTSGLRCSGLLTKSDPLGLLVKTLLASPVWYNREINRNWTMDSQTNLQGEVDCKNIQEYQQYVIETVCSDLECLGYSVQPLIIPACAIGAPHRRDRIWFIAYCTDSGVEKCAKTEEVFSMDLTLLPTPTARDYKGSRTEEGLLASGRNRNNNLCDSFAQPGKTSQLNPLFVGEMMGFQNNGRNYLSKMEIRKSKGLSAMPVKIVPDGIYPEEAFAAINGFLTKLTAHLQKSSPTAFWRK